MAKDPAVLFYCSDFLTGTTGLTMDERGQYITLLCLQHQQGHLSEKTIRLAVGSPSVDVLSKFKKDESGLFFNERMEEETERRHNFVKIRQENGKLGGRPKTGNKAIGYPIGKPKNNLQGNLPINENETEDINRDVVKVEDWNSIRNNFFNDFRWKEKFCIDKNIVMSDLEGRMNEWFEVSMDLENSLCNNIPEHLYNKVDKNFILKVSNLESLRILRDKIGLQKYISLLGAKIINEQTDHQGNQMKLYICEEIKEKSILLEVVCPSTGRVYHLYPPNQKAKTCFEAKASTFKKQANSCKAR